MTSPLVAVTRIFADAGVPYVVIGAHAVNAWIEPRVTADIDVTAQVAPGALARLESVFTTYGYTVASMHGSDLPSGPDFMRWGSSDGLIVIEVQAAKTAFQRVLIERAVASDDGVRLATPEDLIVLKLIANRAKDRVDLLGLMALPSLDWAHVERWAREWDVLDRLRELQNLP